MRGDSFRTSQNRGIYHTLHMWSSLSPHLGRRAKGVQAESDPKQDEKQHVDDDDPAGPSPEGPTEKA